MLSFGARPAPETPVAASTIKPDFSILDDSALLVSYSLKIEIVPTIIAVNEDCFIREILVGFVRDEWNELINQVGQNHSLI